jgi:hypothetical protein
MNVDLDYAIAQIRKIEDGSECRKARDCASRALDALERIRWGLKERYDVDPHVDYDAEDRLAYQHELNSRPKPSEY